MNTEFQFGPWLADSTDYKNPGLEVCTNAIPQPGGYQPALGFSAAAGDVGAAVLSAAMFERKDGTRVTVAATAGDLHVIVGGTVTDSSLGLSLTGPVNFTRFSDWIFASNKQGVWYLTTVESDVTFSAPGWTIPKGKAMARIGDFLFMGDLTDTDTSDAPYRIRWSPFNNPLGNWATDIALQSDAIDMPADLGPVMGITGGAYGLIFQRNGVSRISYTGGGSVFGKQVVDTQRGLVAPNSLAQVGEAVYYLSDDGFFVTTGTAGQTISQGRMWRWFQDNSDRAYWENVQAAVDWPSRCVIWTVPSNAGAVQGLLYYNWEVQQWSYVDQTVDYIIASGRDGMTLEQVSSTYPNLDTMPVSLDSPLFKPQGKSVAAFIGGELRQMNGTTLRATFGTGEFQPETGSRVFVREVAPLITDDDMSALVTLQGRDTQRATYRTAPDVPLGPVGFAPFNFDCRYGRVNITMPAGANWSDAYGFQVEYDVSSRT